MKAALFAAKRARVLEQRLGLETGIVRLEHALDTHSTAGEQHAGGRVVRRTDHGDPRGPGHRANLLVDGEATRDHDGVDARLDRHFLDVRSIADKKDDLRSR